jgi:hypothetical protein
MENLSNSSNIESGIKNFERYVGKLTEKYPFDYENCYTLNNDPYYNLCLTLKPDHSFTAYYLIGRVDYPYTVIEYQASGQYLYNPETKILTLNRNTIQDHKMFDRLKKAKNFSKLEDILKKYYPEKMEIPNFTWVTQTFNWPFILLISPFQDASWEDLDFEMHQCDTVVSDAFVKGKLEFERLCDYIKTSNSLSNLGNKIEAPIQFYETTLLPDGSLTFKSETHARDWGGEYDWDSVVKITGKWNYDSEKRSLTLTYETFNIDDNGKINSPESHNLFPGISVTTNDFNFEMKFIWALNCNFSYSHPQFRFSWSRKNNK